MDYRITEAGMGRVTINGTVASIGSLLFYRYNCEGPRNAKRLRSVMDTLKHATLIIDEDDKVDSVSGTSVGDARNTTARI